MSPSRRIAQERKDAVDFVDAVHQILITMMSHDNSKRRAIVLTRYFEAFSLAGWTGIAVLAAALSFVTYSAFRLAFVRNQNETTEGREEEERRRRPKRKRKKSAAAETEEFSFANSLALVAYLLVFQRDHPVEQARVS